MPGEDGTWQHRTDNTSHSSFDPSRVTLIGNSRAYLAHEPPGMDEDGASSDTTVHEWGDVRYDRLRLLGRTLRWRMDISTVGCGCNAAVYLVSMPQPTNGSDSRYCDIQLTGDRRCLEIDLFEGNTKAARATLHTQKGEASDGTCNQWGCVQALGSGPGGGSNLLYGTGATTGIDTSRPFEVECTFDENGNYHVLLTQDGRQTVLYDPTQASNWPGVGVPIGATRASREALLNGMVLVVSLWGGDMAWLDGGCNGYYPPCTLTASRLVVSQLHVSHRPGQEPTTPANASNEASASTGGDQGPAAAACEAWCQEVHCPYEPATCGGCVVCGGSMRPGDSGLG